MSDQVETLDEWLKRMEKDTPNYHPPKRITVPRWDQHSGKWDLSQSRERKRNE